MACETMEETLGSDMFEEQSFDQSTPKKINRGTVAN